MKVKLENKSGEIKNRKGLDINQGTCVFPFVHKEQEYNQCFKGKEGDWCATEVNPKTKKVRKWAYCDYSIKKTKKKKLKIRTPEPQQNNAAVKSEKFNISQIPENLRITKTSKVKPSYYVLPNRTGFINWFDSMFSTYRVKKDSKLVKSAKFSFFNHQKIIRDYIDSDSPYRGLLLYHGLGVGKTCGSIAIAEGFRSDRKIKVLLNKSLQQNFKENLKKCGYDYFRINQHWFFHKFSENDVMKKYARHLGISLKRDLNGVWLIDFSKEPNYNQLSKGDQQQVDNQINKMIDNKYTFYSMDGLNEKRLKKMTEDREFDDCILIVDEVHNLTNAMAKGKPGVRAKYLEDLIMNANNLKLVFLSGTPMINNLYETAKLFNLLRGKIPAFEITFPGKKSSDINWNKLETDISSSNITDQIIIKKRENFITVTRIPKNYVKQNFKLIKNDSSNNFTDSQFRDELKKLLPSYASVNIEYYTALPDDETKFMNLFYNSEKNEIKNIELFKSRILGLVSFYRTQDKSLIPTIRENEVISIPMSDYQFINYAKVRKAEIQQDKNRKSKKKGKKKKKDEEDSEVFEAKSSYRAYSRMHCSFVFPETIERPIPVSKSLSLEKMGDVLSKITEFEASEGDEDYAIVDTDLEVDIDIKKHIKAYEAARTKALTDLFDRREDYLMLNEEGKLLKYSPKYNAILNKINETKGLAFVYTEYKTLEGIAILSLILKANGYGEFKLKKNETGEYVLDENPEDAGKPMFAFWAGSEDQSELIRKIYNNEFDQLPNVLRKQLEKNKKNNLRGDVIKVLLTTKTGAEGIDLKNVRQVHIVEPYWNPVRLQQVKGRAVRVGSHIELPESERLVDIYVYLSTILPKQKKTEPIIDRDGNGISSDEALFNLSEKKLAIMNTLLRIIKEVSIDCSLNINDTRDTEDPFKCQNYGSSLQNYSYVPNIFDEYQDKEKTRRTVQTSWKPTIVNIPGKGKYGLKPAPADEQQLLFDLEIIRDTGRPGEPVGEIVKKDGKTTVIFYKKSKVKEI